MSALAFTLHKRSGFVPLHIEQLRSSFSKVRTSHCTKFNTKGVKKIMRKPIISRTMLTTKITVKCIDVESEEVFETTQEIPRTYKDSRKLEKAVKEAVETDRVKVVKILSAVECKHLFAMSEQTFINNAKEISGYTAAETAKLFGTTPEQLEVEEA